jgi:hypothetical protein
MRDRASSTEGENLMSVSQWGAFGFGMVLGWFLYFVNRYRKGDVGLGDLTTVIGAVGGAAVTTLFSAGSEELFGAYGLGLATGFFLYFFVLIILVTASENFSADFFLDGRRKRPMEPWYVPDGVVVPAMNFDDDGSTKG